MQQVYCFLVAIKAEVAGESWYQLIDIVLNMENMLTGASFC